MNQLMLHEFHRGLGARFAELNGMELVSDYGDWLAEHAALHHSAGVLDFSFRSRLCLVGADRARFLHGQVTNDVKKLGIGEGCYAVITTAKGKMESDVNIFCLADELLLDFEPGLAQVISQRLEKYIVADDVQIVDAAPHYGLLSVQGPKAEAVVQATDLFADIPVKQLSTIKISDATLGEIYLVNNPRLINLHPGGGHEGQSQIGNRPVLRSSTSEGGQSAIGNELEPPHVVSYNYGFDLFVPSQSLGAVADKLVVATKQVGGRVCGWQAFETARIEAGIPRFGADMDGTNIPLECGLEARAITYTKGCYIGQEVINRIHSVGHVNRELRGLRLADDLKQLPRHGDKLFHAGKEAGYVTSAVRSPLLNANIALGYVRREANQIGTELMVRTVDGETVAKVVALPFG
jgi:folate-binding protein YgfZ